MEPCVRVLSRLTFQQKRTWIRGLGLGVLFVAGALYLGLPSAAARAALSNGLGLVLTGVVLVTTAVAARIGARRAAGGGRPWAWFAVAFGLALAGNLVWAIAEWRLARAPVASLADGLYVLYYPAFLMGVLNLPRQRQTSSERFKLLLDMTTVMLAGLLTLWVFWLDPLMRAASPSGLNLALALAYPTGDLVLLWALVMALYRRAADQPVLPLALLLLGVAVQAITDLMFGQQSVLGVYATGSLLDLGWAFSLVCFGAAAGEQVLAGRSAALPSGAAPLSVGAWLHRVRFGLPFAVILVAFWLLVAGHPENHTALTAVKFNLLALGAGVLLALVIARQTLTLMDNLALARALQVELTERQLAQSALQRLNQELERRVEERTQALLAVNTQLRQSEDRLQRDAFYDGLTKLPNRALFLDRLERSIARAQRQTHYRFAVLFLDFDGFKVVNDSLGHTLGDQLLVEIARRLALTLRNADTIARLGGDEFVVLLEDIGAGQDAIAAAERIQAELAVPFELGGRRFFTSASIGIVLSEGAYEQPSDVLRDADIAMYQAKSLGKARSVVFDATMRQRAVERLNMESELRQALERGEFVLHYQPILDLQTQRISGFEALLRWRHPERGMVSPAEFIPVAEETGLIVPIGQEVLREACRQMAEWHRQFPDEAPLSISVNLSARQFKQTELAALVAGILTETGLAAHSLKLEITESAIMEEADAAIRTLAALRALGVQVQIDDFGTGYSSLSYLYRFPIDTLKIDRSFIWRMGTDGDRSEIVRTIITMAHNLGLSVIAEGVETPEQLERVTVLACEQGQGYLISRPLAPDQVGRYLETRGVAVAAGPLGQG